MNSPLLEAIELTRRYDELVAVNSISFKIESGCCIGLLGPNGAGKTTTVEMLEGLVKPSSGEVRLQPFMIYKEKTSADRGGKVNSMESGKP